MENIKYREHYLRKIEPFMGTSLIKDVPIKTTSSWEKLYFISTNRIDPEKGIRGKYYLYKSGRYRF